MVKTPNPLVELPYTYLMTWFVMHYPSLMSAHESHPEDVIIPFVQRLEKASWMYEYLAVMRKVLQNHVNFEFYRCFPQLTGTGYGEEFRDEAGPDNFSSLFLGCFFWLLNIRPGYLVCHLGPVCRIEPYTHSRFSGQFDYDQFYIGNPKFCLGYEDGLIDRDRA